MSEVDTKERFPSSGRVEGVTKERRCCPLSRDAGEIVRWEKRGGEQKAAALHKYPYRPPLRQGKAGTQALPRQAKSPNWDEPPRANSTAGQSRSSRACMLAGLNLNNRPIDPCSRAAVSGPCCRNHKGTCGNQRNQRNQRNRRQRSSRGRVQARDDQASRALLLARAVVRMKQTSTALIAESVFWWRRQMNFFRLRHVRHVRLAGFGTRDTFLFIKNLDLVATAARDTKGITCLLAAQLIAPVDPIWGAGLLV